MSTIDVFEKAVMIHGKGEVCFRGQDAQVLTSFACELGHPQIFDGLHTFTLTTAIFGLVRDDLRFVLLGHRQK